MFEIVTEYNKEIFFKCYKIHYKVFSKYNTKRTILLTIMCFVLATIALILGITKPETFHTVFASVFFYIMTLVFILGSNIMSDKGIKRTVDKIFNKNPNMNLTVNTYLTKIDSYLYMVKIIQYIMSILILDILKL